MIKVIEIKVNIEPTDRGIAVRFENELNQAITNLFTEQEEKEVENSLSTICRTVNTALVRDLEEIMDNILDDEEEKNEKNMLDEFEEGLKNCKTLEEKLAYTLRELEKTITRK